MLPGPPLQEAWVQSLVGELRSHKVCSTTTERMEVFHSHECSKLQWQCLSLSQTRTCRANRAGNWEGNQSPAYVQQVKGPGGLIKERVFQGRLESDP